MIKNILNTIWNNPKYAMPLLLLIWGVYNYFYGAVITVNEGFGYDGNYYGNTAKFFYEQVFGNQLNFYRIQRIFPSFIINSVLLIFNMPLENYYVVKLFQVYNLILLQLSSILWYKIAEMYQLGTKYIWLGFILLFVNFANTVVAFYYPVLTDVSAFFLGFCLLYFHLKDSLTGKIIITVLGAFTWASFLYFGILSILFPINTNKFFNFKSEKLKRNYLALLIPLPFLALSTYYIYKYYTAGILFPTVKKAIPFISELLLVSAILNYFVMAYFFYSILPALNVTKYFTILKNILLSIKIKHVIICVLMFVLIILAQKYFSDENAPGQTSSFRQVFYGISLYSCLKPLVYVLTSITYYGPTFIIFFFFLKRYRSFVENLGVGIYISFVIAILLLFITEPRYLSNFLPFVVLFTVLVFREININEKVFAVIAIFSFILSKVYIPLYGIPKTDLSSYEFPNQLLFMNTFTLSNVSYFIQLPFIFAIIVYTLFSIKKNSDDKNLMKA